LFTVVAGLYAQETEYLAARLGAEEAREIKQEQNQYYQYYYHQYDRRCAAATAIARGINVHLTHLSCPSWSRLGSAPKGLRRPALAVPV